MIIFSLYFAGFFLLLREAVPWARASTSGVIYTRGYRRQKVSRAEEPDRFAALRRARFQAMGLGALVLAGAVGWTFWSVAGLVLRST